MSKPNDDGTGCALLMALGAIAIGVGCIWGAGAGWLVFGGILLTIMALG